MATSNPPAISTILTDVIIGGLLGRAASTISRELGRGEGEDGCYSPQVARAVYEVRGRCRRPRKLIEGSRLHGWVRDRLVHFRWSPEQIAGRLKAMEPDDPGSRVSHETIYAAIYTHPRGGLKAAMIEALRQAKPSRGRRRTTLAGSSMVPETLRIIHASSFCAKWTATPQRRPWKGSPGR